MKLLLSCLLLAPLCSSWSVSSTGTLHVTQTADVSVMEGETVNITCCWTWTFGRVERVGVNWLKNQTEIKNKTRVISTNISQGCQQKKACNCSTLTFTNITRGDEGKYYCKVIEEIPLLTEHKGNGSVITVLDRDINIKDKTEEGSFSSFTGNSLPLIITLAVVAPILLLTLLCVCILRRKQAIAARVIYEVPHFDSEVTDMDKHSTSSSKGSSQWCQVVVYESFDYFEHTERKQSSQTDLRQRDSMRL